MKRVLITGGAGFIGRQAVPKLLARGYEVHLVSRTPPDIYRNEPSVHCHRCDLFDRREQADLIERVCPSHLLHFAWCTAPGEYWTSIENIEWVQCSLALLQSFIKTGGRRVVFAGTCAEYDWSYGHCSEQLTPTIPASFYGVCKNALRQIFEEYCRRTDVRGAWGRIFFLYGPYEHPSRLVPSTIQSLLQGKRAFCNHGQLLRDFLHVSDAASAFVALLESDVTGSVNIASGSPIAIRDIVDTIAGEMGCREMVDYGPDALSDREPQLLVGDAHRLSDEVGFSPQITLLDGMRTTIDWWKSKPATLVGRG